MNLTTNRAKAFEAVVRIHLKPLGRSRLPRSFATVNHLTAELRERPNDHNVRTQARELMRWLAEAGLVQQSRDAEAWSLTRRGWELARERNVHTLREESDEAC